MGNYAIHEDFRHIRRATFFKNPAKVAFVNTVLRLQFLFTRPPAGLRQRKIRIVSYDDAKIPMYLFIPDTTLVSSSPCVVYLHGGGNMLWIMGYQKKYAMDIAIRHHCIVAMPDYRRLPHHPFPAATEDSYAAVSYLAAHAVELHIDDNHIGVLGSSAGACLAAAVALMARDRNGPKIAFQELHFPAVEGDMKTASMQAFRDTPNWDAELNERMLDKLMANGDCGMPAYAAPLKAENFTDLPPAYIETAEYDCFRDGGLLYAEKLRAANVEVVLHETKGTVHGYDRIIDSEITQNSFLMRDAFLATHL